MDFFQHQDKARNKSLILVFFYLLSLFVVSIFGYLTLRVIVYVPPLSRLMERFCKVYYHSVPSNDFFLPQLFAFVILTTILIAVGMSTVFYLNVGEDGETLARLLSGKKLYRYTKDKKERRFINIVDEMSIAAGIPTPTLYVLKGQTGINALAAGFSITTGLIIVTEGCIKNLTRDEIQAIIAHEFSHIINGDTKLNLILAAMLHGILWVPNLGLYLMELSKESKEDGRKILNFHNGVVLRSTFYFLGYLISRIGYLGVFTACIFQRSISRQREYLADATAVQFTRQTDGLKKLLSRIAITAEGSQVLHPLSFETEHFFFADTISHRVTSLLATHPSIANRVKRIDPSFRGKYDSDFLEDESEGHADKIIESGTRLTAARELLQSLPLKLRPSKTNTAKLLVIAMFLGKDQAIRESKLVEIQTIFPEIDRSLLLRACHIIDTLGGNYYLQVLNLSLPALKEDEDHLKTQFVKLIWSLIDNESAKSFSLACLLSHHLTPIPPRSSFRFTTKNCLKTEISTVLSHLAYTGSTSQKDGLKAYLRGIDVFGSFDLPFPSTCPKLEAVKSAIASLALAIPSIRQALIRACVQVVSADGNLTIEETELLSAICASLDCPAPTFNSGNVLGSLI